MKTLYVSDLDGTLLNSSQTTSDYTNTVINDLVGKGIVFSYATARSFKTSSKVTKGLNANFPLVLYNGAFVLDGKSNEYIISNMFDKTFAALFEDLINSNIYPIVYSFIDGEEKFSYIPGKSSSGMQDFVSSRYDDSRNNPVNSVSDLLKGTPFYITCIDTPQKLEPLYIKYKNIYHCVYSVDMYSGEQWLEFMPKTATKSNAVLQLKKILKCDKIVAFGDGINDIDMFKIADECYAVSNAVDELKEIATGILESNDDDGVAKWLSDNAFPLSND